MKHRLIPAILAAVLAVGISHAEERFIPPIFMKAKLLGMSPSNDGKSLRYQFLILDDFGTMPYRRTDVRALPSHLTENQMLALFADLNETNYMAQTAAVLPDGISLGSTVLVYARWGKPTLGVEEMILHSQAAEPRFLSKHSELLEKSLARLREANIRALKTTIQNMRRNVSRMEENLAQSDDPDVIAESKANLEKSKQKIEELEQELANKMPGHIP